MLARRGALPEQWEEEAEERHSFRPSSAATSVLRTVVRAAILEQRGLSGGGGEGHHRHDDDGDSAGWSGFDAAARVSQSPLRSPDRHLPHRRVSSHERHWNGAPPGQEDAESSFDGWDRVDYGTYDDDDDNDDSGGGAGDAADRRQHDAGGAGMDWTDHVLGDLLRYAGDAAIAGTFEMTDEEWAGLLREVQAEIDGSGSGGTPDSDSDGEGWEEEDDGEHRLLEEALEAERAEQERWNDLGAEWLSSG
jgi:hypothetical protein